MSGKEPKGPLARYAFGYADRNPGKLFWLLHAAMVAFVIWRLIEVRS